METMVTKEVANAARAAAKDAYVYGAPALGVDAGTTSPWSQDDQYPVTGWN